MATEALLPARARSRRLAGPVVGAALLAAIAGCDDAPTTAVVENAFETPADAGAAGAMTVYEVWWGATLFPYPVGPGATSEVERTVPTDEFAYALLAPGWSPGAGGRPPRLVAARSRAKLTVPLHGRLEIAVSDDTFLGDCAGGGPLDADDARLVVERIFPGPFAGVTYDPATCTTTAVSADASPDATSDASPDAAPDPPFAEGSESATPPGQDASDGGVDQGTST